MVDSKIARLLGEQCETVKETKSIQGVISRVILLNKTQPKLRSRVIICCDGTSSENSRPSKRTNIALLHEAVKKTDGGGVQQFTHYVSGCGTGSNTLINANNARTGREMPVKIFEAYMHICRAYQSHRDEIYLVGFSRGAHIAKCVARFIQDFGILCCVSDTVAKEYFDLWLKKIQNSEEDSTVPVKLQHQASFFRQVRIRACALFDTVDTMLKDLPLSWPLAFFPRNEALKVIDHRLSPNIDHAIQALALDEHRDLFRQVSWYQEELMQGNPATRLRQCWFDGCHLNVGGGGGQDYISIIPLVWVISQLHELGLDFDFIKLTKNAESAKPLPGPRQRPMARRFSTLGSLASEVGQKIMKTPAKIVDSASDCKYWFWQAAYRTPGRRFVRLANGRFEEVANDPRLSSEMIHWTVRRFDKKKVLPRPGSMKQASYYQHEDGGWAWRIPLTNAEGTSAEALSICEALYSDCEVMLLYQWCRTLYGPIRQNTLNGQPGGPQDAIVRHMISALTPVVESLEQETNKYVLVCQVLANSTKKNVKMGQRKHKELAKRCRNKVSQWADDASTPYD